jgi:dihydroorotate dehydrogenase/Pyruvate/2-oxoacid:ferredoxin oxidoreductase delta subunit
LYRTQKISTSEGGKSMADISTKIAGVKLPTPFGVSALSPLNFWYPAGPIQQLVDWHKRCIDNGAGFICLPSTIPAEKHEQPVRKNHVGPRESNGYVVVCPSVVQLTVEQTKRLAETLRKSLPVEVPIVGNIMDPASNAEKFYEMAKELESSGIDLLDVNTGCPTETMGKSEEVADPGAKYGLFAGSSPELAVPLVKAAVEAVKIPVGVKLTPQAGFPGMMVVAEACIAAGAKYLLTAHMPLAFGPFDIWNGGKPLYPVLKHVEANPLGPYGGGEAIRVINNFSTACASMFFSSSGIDVWAGGGIVTGEHLVESIMLGARAGQTASGVMLRGISQLRRSVKFLEGFMSKCGYETIEDFRGLALRYVKDSDKSFEDTRKLRLAAEVDASKCTGCGTCAESICPCITVESGLAEVKQENCAACGLCILVCPEGAVSMASCESSLGERIEMGKDYTTV